MNKYEEFTGFSDPEADRSVLLDSRLARRTQSLFLEVHRQNNRKTEYKPLYTMREQDKDGCISAYQIYMHSIDEYDAALKLVGSLDHWNRLLGLKWFREGGINFKGINQWRSDMWYRDNRMAKEALLQRVKYNNDAQAARQLANWDKNHKPPNFDTPIEKPARATDKPAPKQEQDHGKVTQINDALERVKARMKSQNK